MAGPLIIDGDQYDFVTSMAGADIVFQPKTKPDGTRDAPLIMKLKEEFRHKPKEKPKRRRPVDVEMIENDKTLKWNPHIPICTKLEPVEYKKVIDWWFTEANKNDADYFKTLEAQYFTMDIPSAVKWIREKQLEDYHTYKSVENPETGEIEYTARIKDIGRKITTLLQKYKRENKFLKKK